ncbi:hypothetical protein PAQ31011_03040 [Pandoraea aquatica]|uniref:IPT/TIG domain-containing protein n=1 Tax=Pandoraea aquatica TaxID=2508290 RepID=A0A5E4W1M1_9BURK|nr:hypothetical protein [Pandoraea aquatica]VVE18807.1 hypothetical protein PAQ31011_03040 [Pandoraea aquatica]
MAEIYRAASTDPDDQGKCTIRIMGDGLASVSEVYVIDAASKRIPASIVTLLSDSCLDCQYSIAGTTPGVAHVHLIADGKEVTAKPTALGTSPTSFHSGSSRSLAGDTFLVSDTDNSNEFLLPRTGQ